VFGVQFVKGGWMKYYKTDIGYAAVDPRKKVYYNGQPVPELVCGRGHLYYRRNKKYFCLDSVIGDQVYKLSDLGTEVPLDKVDTEWIQKLEERKVATDDYAARWFARVLVWACMSVVIWCILQCF
jgi:hypothetical protein